MTLGDTIMATFDQRRGKDGKLVYRARLKGHPIQTATFPRLTDARTWAQRTEAAILEGCARSLNRGTTRGAPRVDLAPPRPATGAHAAGRHKKRRKPRRAADRCTRWN